MKTEPAITTPQPAPTEVPRKLTPKQVKRARRKQAFLRFWAQFRTNKAGMVGLGILLLFLLVAISSIFAYKGRLDPTIVNGPRLAGPSLKYPLGTQVDGVS